MVDQDKIKRYESIAAYALQNEVKRWCDNLSSRSLDEAIRKMSEIREINEAADYYKKLVEITGNGEQFDPVM